MSKNTLRNREKRQVDRPKIKSQPMQGESLKPTNVQEKYIYEYE